MTKSSTNKTKGELTAQRILDAAEELFAIHGFQATSLREVALKVGIQEPGIYRHFSSKSNLYEEVLSRGLKPLSIAMAEKLVDKTPQKNLATLPGEILEVLAERPRIAILLQHAAQQKPEDLPEAMQIWLQELINQGKKLLKQSGFTISKQQASLRILNFFNLCTSYFSSQHLIANSCNANPLSKKMLEQQKELVNQVAVVWLKDQKRI